MEASRPNIDIESRYGNRWVLVAKDLGSKLSISTPMRKKSNATTEAIRIVKFYERQSDSWCDLIRAGSS